MDPRPHLHGMLPEEIAEHLRTAGVAVRDDEARRILAHRLVKKRHDYAPVRPISKRLAAEAAARFDAMAR